MWELLWSVGVPGFVGALYLCNRLHDNHEHLDRWQKAMALCQTDEVESSSVWAWRAKLKARVDWIEMRITKAAGKKKAVVVVEGAEGFSILKLSRQILKLWKREIEVGDEAFDGAFIVEGPVQPVSALLDATLRGQLLRAYADCDPLEIGDGRLRVEVSEEELYRVLPVLFKIGRKLSVSPDVKSRIAHNARLDPEPGVRLSNLLLLIREHPGDPDTLKALRTACKDKSPKVRVRAAIELGDEGRDVLLNLAEKVKDDASSALAVSHLGGKLPFGKAREALSRALRNGSAQTARACLETLGQRRAVAVGVLARVLAEEKGELAVAAAQALGATGEAAAEPPLLKALVSEESDLREAAAAALGKAGTVAAVQPLKDAIERFWLDLGLRRAARQAIAEIQSRIEGASPGQLSLAQVEAGQLSLTQAEAGQVSLAVEPFPLPPEEPEQLSWSGTGKELQPGREGAA